MSTPQSLARLATLFGGEELEVQKMDASKIKVKVGIVPVRHLGTFVDLYDKPAELADFVCHVDGKPAPEGWADCLTDIAIEEIRQKAKALNLARALVWTETQISAGKELAEPIVKKLMALRTSVLTQLVSSAAAANNSSTKPSPGSAS